MRVLIACEESQRVALEFRKMGHEAYSCDLEEAGGGVTTSCTSTSTLSRCSSSGGTKTFEIRKNDRGYKVGDEIVFDVVTNEGYAVGEAARHPLNGEVYRIDYILDDFEGLAQKYVALAISKVDE